MPTAGDIFYFASKQGSSSKPAIVLIHGAGGTHLHWPHNVRRLGDYRVVAPDLPGHGNSNGLGEQTIEGYANWLVKWLVEIGVSRAIFIGHSMGGAIAQMLALEHSEHVLGIGLVATGAKLPVNADLLEKISMPATFPGAVDMIVKWSYTKDFDPKTIAQVKKKMLECRPSVMHGDFLACNTFNVLERLDEIKVPACVICGSEDKMTPPRFSEALAESISGAALNMIPDAGHMVMLERPEGVTETLNAFVQQLG